MLLVSLVAIISMADTKMLNLQLGVEISKHNPATPTAHDPRAGLLSVSSDSTSMKNEVGEFSAPSVASNVGKVLNREANGFVNETVQFCSNDPVKIMERDF